MLHEGVKCNYPRGKHGLITSILLINSFPEGRIFNRVPSINKTDPEGWTMMGLPGINDPTDSYYKCFDLTCTHPLSYCVKLHCQIALWPTNLASESNWNHLLTSGETYFVLWRLGCFTCIGFTSMAHHLSPLLFKETKLISLLYLREQLELERLQLPEIVLLTKQSSIR